MLSPRIHIISESTDVTESVGKSIFEIDSMVQIVKHRNNMDFLSFHDEEPLWEIVVTDLIQISMPNRTTGQFVPVIHINNNMPSENLSSYPWHSSCVSLGNIKQRLAETIASSRSFLKLRSGITKLDTLDARERTVILLVAEGAPNKAIARRLNVSVKTIEHCRRKAYLKLDVKSSAEVASLVTFGKFFSMYEKGNSAPYLERVTLQA